MTRLVKYSAATTGILGLLALAPACAGETKKPTTEAKVEPKPEVKAEPRPAAGPAQGGPTLILAEAQFIRGADNKPKPGPALLTFWQRGEGGWSSSTLEDPDSNVFHKVLPAGDGGFYTIGAEGAQLKKWTRVDGAWKGESLWNPKWEGKFNRIRDLEAGDVTGDGKDDLVMATHDAGVLGVGTWGDDGKLVVTEYRKQADTFVHEIEICDVDGDGKNEFFATPSARNQSSGESQPGQVIMMRWDGTTFQETVLDDFVGSHAKEILCANIDGQGPSEFFSVIEAETEIVDGKPKVKKPVEIRQYAWKGKKVSHSVIATIDDRQTRFLVPGDFDQDGKLDMVAAAMKTGLYLLTQKADGGWDMKNIAADSGGFEHTSVGADFDKDGKLELYVASDDQKEFRVYRYNAGTQGFDKEVIGPIQKDTITWNVAEIDL
ncbi:MAG: VCBS repeat-containing protein [Deltaproteobacteria bacterium]|nr:VCBS repeat-containing protein [Deltaproteobacteria bacterium]